MNKTCLAVDVGKSSSCYALYRTHDPSLGAEGVETLIPPRKVANSRRMLMSLLKEAKEKSGDGFVVAMESTGIYHLPIQRFFADAGQEVIVINPLITGKTVAGLRLTKTDALDTMKIALSVFRGEQNRQRCSSPEYDKMRDLARMLESAMDRLAAAKTKLLSVLWRTAPEYEKCFEKSGVFAKSVLALVEKYPHSADIRAARRTSMEGTMLSAMGFKSSKRSVECVSRLKEASKDSLPCVERDSPLRDEAAALVRETRRMKMRADELSAELADMCRDKPLFGILTGIEGLNEKMAALITAETGDMDRFETRQQFAAFAGTDPRKKESGTSLNADGSITKRGNSHLRRWLSLAALVFIMHADAGDFAKEIEGYYRAKRGTKENGGATHHHLYALTAATNKLIRKIFGKYKALAKA